MLCCWYTTVFLTCGYRTNHSELFKANKRARLLYTPQEYRRQAENAIWKDIAFISALSVRTFDFVITYETIKNYQIIAILQLRSPFEILRAFLINLWMFRTMNTSELSFVNAPKYHPSLWRQHPLALAAEEAFAGLKVWTRRRSRRFGVRRTTTFLLLSKWMSEWVARFVHCAGRNQLELLKYLIRVSKIKRVWARKPEGRSQGCLGPSPSGLQKMISLLYSMADCIFELAHFCFHDTRFRFVHDHTLIVNTFSFRTNWRERVALSPLHHETYPVILFTNKNTLQASIESPS